jgi:uncharacterized Zn finger protein (UPF0148 family)
MKLVLHCKRCGRPARQKMAKRDGKVRWVVWCPRCKAEYLVNPSEDEGE